MYYPYEEVESAARQNPPPEPPADNFPLFAYVIALYVPWAIAMGHRFRAADAESNARETISRVNNSKLVNQLHDKWRFARTASEQSKWAGMAWDSYQKNVWNTVSGTCAEALAKRELGKLSPDSLIKWLPSTAHDIDLVHLKEYYQVMTVREAISKELCIRIGCKCGWHEM